VVWVLTTLVELAECAGANGIAAWFLADNHELQYRETEVGLRAYTGHPDFRCPKLLWVEPGKSARLLYRRPSARFLLVPVCEVMTALKAVLGELAERAPIRLSTR
jgi:hypothetical protein